MHQFSAHTVAHSSTIAHTVAHSSTTDDQTSDSNLAVSDSHTETDIESSVFTSDSEKSYADITKILMAQPDQPNPGQTSHTEPYVDIPSEFVDLPEVSSAPAVLHDQFLGDPSAVFEAARRDYLNMKCCSLNAKDLDFHYKRMSLLFYKLNGFNEPTLKHVFLASLPDELQPDIQRQLTASNLSLDNISLGKIFQLAKTCLDKLCEQKQFFKELLKDKEPFRSACKKPYLQIKCKKKKYCDCSPKKKRHFKKSRNPEFSSRPHRSRMPYRFFRKKSSSSRDFKRQKSSRCFICKRKSHYAQDCPNKRDKSIRLVEHLQATTDYSPEKDELEFYFSEQDEPNDETVFALQNSSDDSDSDQSQIFPNCVIWTKVIGPTLANKDILLGFDILHQIKHLQIIPTGIRVKSMFKLFTDILKLYNLSETPPSYQDISTKLLSFCPESHAEITHPNPLWKNKSFFVKLPFKLNEDINPTKATHPGMSPSNLLLAQQECSQLLAQGLIEPTNSQWACQAFYVEKHSEIVRGKKRLVIDYQPLNMFLQDDKFPLPRRQSIFTFLKNAQIFSKFDLKSGSHDEHRQLLTQFYDIVQSHGIMLSAKKSTIATDNIEFLGLTLDLSRETTEDVLLYIWCLTVLYATKPYFQHPDTKLFWTHDQVYEWFTAPHLAVIENEIQSTLHNYLCQLNHQTPPHKDIFHTSLGPQHDLIMIPTPSAISKPKSTCIIIKEEKPDYTDFLFQDSQDPWDAFLPLSQHLHQFPQLTMDEPGPSQPGPSFQPAPLTQPTKVDKATQTSP
ncbi:hypothetical protein KPL70_023615 [Citrus sinensis]|nr:hypothetical protein KPL70_023615 [Citrus sinensis]